MFTDRTLGLCGLPKTALEESACLSTLSDVRVTDEE